MLFIKYTRTDDQTIRLTESEFDFLNRCAWPKAERVRSLLELCLSNYPAAEQSELIARLQSRDSRHFSSAAFELLLHEYLIRQGFVLTPHPELPNGSLKRPDFLVTCPDRQQFYLEAVCASDRDGKNDAAEMRKDLTLDYLNSMHHDNFFLEIESSGDPSTQPSGKRLAVAVKEWLNSLNPDSVLEGWKNRFEALDFAWQHEDWRLTVRAIPLEIEKRGRRGPLIGIRNYGATWVDGWTPIRNAIQNKTRRYGSLNFPLVVAVNVHGFRLNPIEETQALFGEEQFIFNLNNSEDPSFTRGVNGAWRGPDGPRGKRCSGAWLFGNLSPYKIINLKHTLYINPWADLPLTESALIMPLAKVESDQIERVDGKSFQEVLGLDLNWPE